MRFRDLALQRAKIAKHGNGKLSVPILFATLLNGTKVPPAIMMSRIRQHDQLTTIVFSPMAAHGWNDRVAKLSALLVCDQVLNIDYIQEIRRYSERSPSKQSHSHIFARDTLQHGGANERVLPNCRCFEEAMRAVLA